MGTFGGTNSLTNGLVFGYDADDRSSRFYKGEPTTNLFTSYEPMVWFNSGSANISSNSTDILKPNDIMLLEYNLNILRGECTVAGSQHFGTNIISISPSTTYTFSIWFRQNRAGSNQPYLRTNVNNDSLGNFSYNGDPYSANWPINTWIRISVTATTQLNENGVYLSNYIGGAVGDIVWYYAPQLEQKSHMTQYTYGTRSSTTSLIDLKKTQTIDLSNMSFSSTAHPIFDGTDDYINCGTTSFNFEQGFTTEVVANFTNIGSWQRLFDFGNGPGSNNILFSRYSTTDYLWFEVYNGGGSSSYINTYLGILNNQMCHYVATINGTTANIYRNGLLINSGPFPILPITVTRSNCYIGKSNWNDTYYQGKIPIIKMYNRAISEVEVKQNYNSIKERYNL